MFTSMSDCSGTSGRLASRGSECALERLYIDFVGLASVVPARDHA